MEQVARALVSNLSKEKPTGPSDVALRGSPDEPARLLWSLAILFRASGITAYVENKGTLETARKIAAHESPRSTTLYDRTDDRLTLDEIEKISV
jgi:hypothetical protein